MNNKKLLKDLIFPLIFLAFFFALFIPDLGTDTYAEDTATDTSSPSIIFDIVINASSQSSFQQDNSGSYFYYYYVQSDIDCDQTLYLYYGDLYLDNYNITATTVDVASTLDTITSTGGNIKCDNFDVHGTLTADNCIVTNKLTIDDNCSVSGSVQCYSCVMGNNSSVGSLSFLQGNSYNSSLDLSNYSCANNITLNPVNLTEAQTKGNSPIIEVYATSLNDINLTLTGYDTYLSYNSSRTQELFGTNSTSVYDLYVPQPIYNITYDCDMGTLYYEDYQTTYCDNDLPMTLPVLYVQGFAGWRVSGTDTDYDDTVIDEIPSGIDHDITLTPEYETMYNITYNADMSSFYNDYLTYYYSSMLPLSLPSLSNSNFSGWLVSGNSSKYNGKTITTLPSDIYGDITLTPVYKNIKKYSITSFGENNKYTAKTGDIITMTIGDENYQDYSIVKNEYDEDTNSWLYYIQATNKETGLTAITVYTISLEDEDV